MKLKVVRKGGPGSGFHGHAGRPGEVGGSSSGGGVAPRTEEGGHGSVKVSRAKKDFPYTFEAITDVAHDNNLDVDDDWDIPRSYLKRFSKAEPVFADASKTKFEDVFGLDKIKIEGYDQDDYDNHTGMSLTEVLAMGEYEAMLATEKYYNKKGMAGSAAYKLLNDAFEGPLDSMLKYG